MSRDTGLKVDSPSSRAVQGHAIWPLCDGLSTLQQIMQRTLRGMNHFCNPYIYIDDILVFSDTVEEHVEHVTLAFQHLLEVSLNLHVHLGQVTSAPVAFASRTFSKNEVKY